ncbi:PhzF family isomerase [uncultured Helicobacter sp.]|uniref:PhzF family isomerase n=1 Tax=uncultured Helicobacter sp. TaxID=175537 RepID=UPI002631B075|nr:PhzF family isomerase [uncultured Helicobacter sp.]
MKVYRIYQVDSFTKNKFYGNPAGVIPNADGLSNEQMQQIARELNNSETAFVFSPIAPNYDMEVRFFTPTKEVPICGHATIATHYIRALEGEKIGKVLQKTRAGILPVEIIQEKDDFSITMTQGKPKVETPLDRQIIDEIIHALGLKIQDIRQDCPVAISSTGHSKVMIGIKENQCLNTLKPNLESLSVLSSKLHCNGYYLFTLNFNEKPFIRGRMFSPAIGIAEDPVTGNANGALGAYLVTYRIAKHLETPNNLSFEILQGEAIQRLGSMCVNVEIKNGKPFLVKITGKAVVCFKTEISI